MGQKQKPEQKRMKDGKWWIWTVYFYLSRKQCNYFSFIVLLMWCALHEGWWFYFLLDISTEWNECEMRNGYEVRVWKVMKMRLNRIQMNESAWHFINEKFFLSLLNFFEKKEKKKERRKNSCSTYSNDKTV